MRSADHGPERTIPRRPNHPPLTAARARRILFYLLLAGLLARVLYLTQLAGLPFFQDPVGDSAWYLQRAHEILDGRLVGDRPFFYGAIPYPYLLALFIAVFGDNIFPIALAQAGAGCALGWVLYRIAVNGAGPGRIDAGRKAGLIAAALAIFYGPLAFLEADVLMIVWTLLLVMLAASLLLRVTPGYAARGSLRRLAGAGLCLGLAAAGRPNMAPLLPAAALWVLAFAGPRLRVRGAVALLAGGSAVIAGIMALNRAASGHWIPLTTSAGINFYIGNHEEARGTFDEPWSGVEAHFTARETDLEMASLQMARRLSGRELDAVGASRFWLSRGLEFIREQPWRAVRLYVRKLALMWNAVEVPNHLNFEFFRSATPALWLMPLGFGLVAPLGLYGLVSRRSRRWMAPQLLVLLCLLILVPVTTLLPFFVADRYRAVFVPPLIVAAGFGLLALKRTLPESRPGPAAARIGALVALAFLMSLPMTAYDLSREHWLMAQALQKKGDLPAAAAEYARALEESPGNAVLLNNLGVVKQRMGEFREAETIYREAIAADPRLAFPQKNLGLLLIDTGRAGEAFEHLTLAERSEPDDVDIARALAALYLSRGDPEAARRRAEKVLVRRPADRTALAVIEAIDRDARH